MLTVFLVPFWILSSVSAGLYVNTSVTSLPHISSDHYGLVSDHIIQSLGQLTYSDEKTAEPETKDQVCVSASEKQRKSSFKFGKIYFGDWVFLQFLTRSLIFRKFFLLTWGLLVALSVICVGQFSFLYVISNVQHYCGNII